MKGKISKIKNTKGELALPITTVEAVYLEDGKTKLSDEIKDVLKYEILDDEGITAEIPSVIEEIDGIKKDIGEINSSLDKIETKKANSNDVYSKQVVNVELDKKRDKTVSIMLSDLHTEVKTAMTGGSVPVVGTNSIGEENYKDDSISKYKLKAKSVTIEKLVRTVQPIIKSSVSIKTVKNGNALNITMNGNIYLYEKNLGAYSGYKNLASIVYDMPNYSNLLWNLDDNTISVINDGVTISTTNYVILLTNVNGILYGELAHSLDTTNKLSSITDMVYPNYIRSTSEITFTSNTDNSCDIVFSNGSLYLYERDLSSYVKKLTVDGLAFHMNNWSNLVWDLDDNIVKNLPDSTKITNKYILIGRCLKGKFLSEQMIITNLYDNSENDIQLPSYWKAHIDEKVNEINSIITENGRDVFGFFMSSDHHVQANAKNTALIIDKIKEGTGLKTNLALGDFVNDESTAEGTISKLKLFFNLFNNKERLLTCLGNHDTKVYGTTNLIPLNNLYREIYYHLDDVEFPTNNEQLYYYYDDEKEKVRYIMLNTNDVNKNGRYDVIGFSEKQIKWLGGIALNFEDKKDEEWSIVIASHIALRADSLTRNSSKIVELLNAFKNKQNVTIVSSDDVFPIISTTFNFANRKNATLITWVSGHEHIDKIQDFNGIKQIWMLNDSYQQYVDSNNPTPTRTTGTITEHAIDVVLVNRKTKRIDCIRVGAGDNRNTTF